MSDHPAPDGRSCAIIYGQESDEHPAFIQAAEEYFDTVLGVPFENVRILYDDGITLRYRETELNAFDCIFLRFFDTDMLHGERIPVLLDQLDVYTPMAAESLFIASNKFHTINVLGTGGVPVPYSVYTLSTAEAERVADQFGYPVVVKLISGYGGQGVMRVQNPEDLSALIDTLTMFEQDICLQEYVENPGEDVRIVVIGDETYSYKRIAGEEEWRSNVAAGGHMEPYDAPEEMRDAARRAAELAGFDVCGVDVIGTEEDFVIAEINASPALKGDEERVGIDLYDRVMAYIYDRTEAYLAATG